MNVKGVSQQGVTDIFGEEGKRLKPYKDIAGKWTIAFGHLIQFPSEQWMMNGVTEQQALDIFNKDCAKFNELISDRITRELTQRQYDALFSLVYNIPISITTGTVDNILNREGEINLHDLEIIWTSYDKFVDPKTGLLTYSKALDDRRKREIEIFKKATELKKKKTVCF